MNTSSFTAFCDQVQVVATDVMGNSRTNVYQLVVPSGGVQSLSYDTTGNLLNDGAGKAYKWDNAGRLSKIITRGNEYSFGYDAEGRRVTERVNGTLLKQWIWKGGNHPSVELDGAGNVLERRFVQGFQRGNQNYYVTRDHLGSVREVVDAGGTTRAKYDYDPYGKRTRIAGDMDYVHGFTGHYHHESGLILTWYRGYDVELGRWISRDPIQERGGINLYGYFANSPIFEID